MVRNELHSGLDAQFLTTHTDRRIPGYIKGFVRRFWQVGSPKARLGEGRGEILANTRFWYRRGSVQIHRAVLTGLRADVIYRNCSEDHRGTPEE
jgi:hypothetical protein